VICAQSLVSPSKYYSAGSTLIIKAAPHVDCAAPTPSHSFRLGSSNCRAYLNVFAGMAPRNIPAAVTIPHAPDSPRSSLSPPPSGVQGDLELELLGLANALYNLGTTVINDSTKEKDKPGGGKQVGLRVNDVVNQLSTIDEMAQHTQTMVPIQVLTDIDNARNPMQLTRDRLERAATENQFMNGKIAAIDSYRKYLDEALLDSFPELGPHLLTVAENPGGSSPETALSGPNGPLPTNGRAQ